ncbi:MAG: MgtC/SapB family protein [Balneolaceae bacterium]|jgi:putative Mg2+ transporter-C (MgtC) family protein
MIKYYLMLIPNFDLVWLPVFKVVVAIFLGGLIGLERELAAKPAGLRTHMLVAGASSLLVILGEIMIKQYAADTALTGAIRADPIRIIEAIITGISFLGAGTIIFRGQRESVEGLTTAASILFAAAIGITVALHRYFLAIILTIFVILILLVLGYIERFIRKFRRPFHEEKSNE